MLQICDKVQFEGTKREMTPEGFMRVPATLARCGVYDYSAEACKRMPEMQKIREKLNLSKSEPLRVYRSPEHVFAEDSMSTFSGKPVTNNHPPEWITAKNAKYYTIGHAGDSIEQDGIFQKATLIITDAEVIQAIEDGKKEISNGYECDVIMNVGITDAGESYHAEFRNIRGNHIAIVSKGRAGSGCRISDSNQTETERMKTIVYDGITHEVSENAFEIIGKIRGDMQKVQDSLEAAEEKHTADLAKVQANLDTEKQKVIDAESKILDGEELDKRIEARSVLVADAKSLDADFDCSGKTDAEIIEGVVLSVCDGVDLEGKDDGYKAVYCKARFDGALATKDMKSDNAGSVKVGDANEEEEEDESEKARKNFMNGKKSTKED